MVEEYRRYLLNIRNNLIQCGVEFPINAVLTYEDMFELSQKLEDVLWFYSILAISGSEDALNDFFLPLNGYYKDKMRSLYYKEFIEFAKEYKELSTEEAVRRDSLNKGYYVGGGNSNLVDTVARIEEGINTIAGAVTSVGAVGNSILKPEESREPKEADHGVFIDEDLENSLEGILASSHGVFIDDDLEEYSDDDFGSEESEFYEPEEGYVSHGKYLDDDLEEDGEIDDPYDFFEDPDELEGSLDEEEDLEDEEDAEIDDPYDFFEDPDEDTEVEEDLEDPEEGEEDAEIDDPYAFFEDSNDEEIEDVEDVVDEDDEIEDPYDLFEDEEDVIDPADFLDGDDEEDVIDPADFLDDDEEETGINSSGSLNKDTPVSQSSSTPPVKQHDLSDILQDITNGILTSSKKTITKKLKKIKE